MGLDLTSAAEVRRDHEHPSGSAVAQVLRHSQKLKRHGPGESPPRFGPRHVPCSGRQFDSDTQYPEPCPNLLGWDDRINLPHVALQPAALNSGAGAAMVGVIEEVQARMTAGCTEPNAGNDTLRCNLLGMMTDIYGLPIGSGGFEANTMGNSCDGAGNPLSGVPSFIDCRQPQHDFLSWVKTLRVNGQTVRNAAAGETNPARRPHDLAQYAWIRGNWFEGADLYKESVRKEARMESVGMSCLPGLCP